MTMLRYVGFRGPDRRGRAKGEVVGDRRRVATPGRASAAGRTHGDRPREAPRHCGSGRGRRGRRVRRAGGCIARAPRRAPDTVVPNAQILPSAVGCWNAIAVQAVRLDTAYPPQGLLYMGYVQGAVYDAVTKIEGRYVPYQDFDVPPAVHVAGVLTDAATAAAAYTMLTSHVPRLAAGRPGRAVHQVCGLHRRPRRTRSGVALLPASPSVRPPRAGLIANRAGDRDESITFTPGPLTAEQMDVRALAIAAIRPRRRGSP